MDTADRLAAAAAAGDIGVLTELLSAGGVVDGRRRTALDRALWAGRADAVRLLVAAGADVEQPIGEYREDTPLRFAAGRGDLPLVHLLLDAGAEPDGRRSPRQATPLMVAAAAGETAVAEALLIRGADIERTGGGKRWTSLEWAGHAGRADTVRLLLAQGAARTAAALERAREGESRALAAMRAGEHPEVFSPARMDAYREAIRALASAVSPG
jgi:ankyrin repeat protein